jgi:CubicO group peptidase (beta-lactamase class C family)
MKSSTGRTLIAVVLSVPLCSTQVGAEERPVSGKKVPGFEPVDKAIHDFMDTIGCQAATVAVSRDGRLVYSRGYGWSDKEKKKRVAPDALMRIASVSKPITAAAVRNAIRANQLSLDTKAFELIAVKAPGGKVADARIGDITVGQLLEHKGGWDREKSFDPMFRTRRIEKELSFTKPARPVNVIEYMLTQPLQFTPGEKTVYSNFGYCVLGRVLEKVMKKPYSECIQQSVCKPLGLKDIKVGSSDSKKRDAREVWYPVADDAFSIEVMDAHGGLIASAPALCQFLQGDWVSGEPRQPGQRQEWTFFGSLPGTTAMVRQRPDGLNIAVLLNGRRDLHLKEDNDALKEAIEKAIDQVGKGEKK